MKGFFRGYDAIPLAAKYLFRVNAPRLEGSDDPINKTGLGDVSLTHHMFGKQRVGWCETVCFHRSDFNGLGLKLQNATFQ